MREDWVEIELRDLAKNPKKDIVDGPFGSNLKSGEYVKEGIPVFKIQNIKSNRFVEKRMCYVTPNKAKQLERHSFLAGDLIITKLGNPLGLCCEVPSRFPFGIIVADLLRFRSDTDLVYKSYLRHCINSHFIQSQLKKITKGTTRPRVNLTIVRGLRFLLPPLVEQRAIVSKIEELFSELDNGIVSLKKAQEQLIVYRQAVLKKAFEGELTKEWREQQKDLPSAEELLEQIQEERQRHYEQQLEEWKGVVKTWEDGGKVGKKPKKPKVANPLETIELSEMESLNSSIPQPWKWVRLANVVTDYSNDIVDGPFGSNLKSTEYVESGKPILRIQNIKSNQFINKNIKYVTEEKYDFLARHQFKPNDVIVTKLGAPLGLACRVPLDFGKGVIVADLIRITPSSSYIDYDWLTQLINSHILQQQFKKITKGTTRPRMNLTIMRNVVLPLSSKKEQHQIVQEIESRLSVCDNVEENIKVSLSQAEALRQSILKKAFEGKLLTEAELEACRKEADWEPASVLLERIREEKEAAALLAKEAKKKAKKSKKTKVK